MAELENIIESVMSSPESMGKIMDIVKMFGGGQEPESEKEKESPPLPVPGGDLLGLDPAMLSKIMELIGNYSAEDDRRIRLLGAIRPYLKEEDSFHIDRAIHIVKLSRVAKGVLSEFVKSGGKRNV